MITQNSLKFRTVGSDEQIRLDIIILYLKTVHSWLIHKRFRFLPQTFE